MTAQEAVERAREAVEASQRIGGIKYALGQGGLTPSAPFPWNVRGLDCTGFTAWAFAFSRNHPDAGWINSDAMVVDGRSPGGLFTQVDEVGPGDALVFGGKMVRGKWRHGHAGMVIAAKDGKATKVAHCSVSNYSNTGNALGITGPEVFIRNGAIAVRFEGFTK